MFTIILLSRNKKQGQTWQEVLKRTDTKTNKQSMNEWFSNIRLPESC